MLPIWAKDLISLYESNAANQFVIYGNVGDRMLLPLEGKPEMGTLDDFLLRVLLPHFDVVLSYDVGNGIRVLKGNDVFSTWPFLKECADLPSAPRPAIETLTRYFRYAANLAQLKRQKIQVACLLKNADLIAPAFQGGLSYDLSALASLIRDWANDSLLAGHTLATFLITENLNDLHPLIVNNPRTAHIKIPLPSPDELKAAFDVIAPSYATAFAGYKDQLDTAARQLAGATISTVEGMLKTKEHEGEKIKDDDLVQIKKRLVEKDCNDLIEFLQPTRTLNDIQGQEKVKTWLRQDIALWKKNDVEAIPKGYLLCGPVGTGKTYMVECLAGEAGLPVVKMKNFRDKWVGSSEGNLEKIFRLLQALGRCYVFIDEADQAIGRRDSGGTDTGVSGRIYSMMAEEMGNSDNRGKIIWILASSRPDLIEVDLKRPGRVDVKIPLFPTSTAEESFQLVRMLCRKRGLDVPETIFGKVEKNIPLLLTPGAAETLAVKIYRLAKVDGKSPAEALQNCLGEYQNPVPKEIMDFQIQLALQEASDLEFVPPYFRSLTK